MASVANLLFRLQVRDNVFMLFQTAWATCATGKCQLEPATLQVVLARFDDFASADRPASGRTNNDRANQEGDARRFTLAQSLLMTPLNEWPKFLRSGAVMNGNALFGAGLGERRKVGRGGSGVAQRFAPVLPGGFRLRPGGRRR
jgi:hypothetical protein